MGKTEVTQQQYEEVMGDKPWSKMEFVAAGDDYPAVYVTWEKANSFCRVLSNRKGEKYKYRLPTEAEWEYACRAGEETAFGFGDDASALGGYAWFYDNTYDVNHVNAHPVGQKRPNPFGLYDMHGNVWEWCSDEWHENYKQDSVSDPNCHVYRGGSMGDLEHRLSCSYRIRPPEGDQAVSYTGFRVVCSHR